MRFSILVPVYNVEKYLKQCIDSVLSQDFDDYELILVNDGSTDSSPQICMEYAERDGRIHYFSKENEGLLLTRRYSVKRAQGEYVLFLDSDDYWESGLLTRVNRAIVESAADMILYRFRRIRDDGSPVLDDKDVFADKTLFDENNKEEFIKAFVSSSRLNPIWGKCVRRDIIDTDADYSAFGDKKGEDALQSIALIRNASSIYYINDVLYNYRLSASGRGRNFKLKYITDYDAVGGHVLKQLKEMRVSEDTVNLFYRNYMRGILTYLNPLVRVSKSFSEFSGHCHTIRNLPVFMEAADALKKRELRRKVPLNQSLFMGKKDWLLYEKCKAYNWVKALVK